MLEELEIDKSDDFINYPQVRCPHCKKIYQINYYPRGDLKRFDEQKCKFCNKKNYDNYI